MKIFSLIYILAFLSLGLSAQNHSIAGTVVDEKGLEVSYANIILYSQADNSTHRIGVSDMEGNFNFREISSGSYSVDISFIGMESKKVGVEISNEDIDLGKIKMELSGIQLQTTVITARRPLVEVKSDKTILNVEGTINSAGDNALGLLRKAPGVLVDNTNNISVMGRSGVIVYINGKRLPLSGDDLTAYLESLNSEQIDRVEIISNPGARYEAQGNAGIIDIRLKRNDNFGTNGNLAAAYSQGRYNRYNVNTSLNNRTEKMNVFGSGGLNIFNGFWDMISRNTQNNVFTDGINNSVFGRNGYNVRAGMDYFIDNRSTVGILYTGSSRDSEGNSMNRIEISSLQQINSIDSILVARNRNERTSGENTFNINYSFNGDISKLNIDLDYGRFRNDGFAVQPNTYYDPSETNVLSSVDSEYETPVKIDIYTLKVDHEQDIAGGKLGLGTKISKVNSDNTYMFYNIAEGQKDFITSRSNRFAYDENVYAAYANYSRKLNGKINLNGGLRYEYTDATGDLTAFETSLNEEPVKQGYSQWFPSLGLSYSIRMGNTINLNYSRRLNRPNYNVLNPFREQLSELSFSKGNPFLTPEILNNYELSYTHAFRYNFKLSYSRTIDQITRLIGPDGIDPRASYITWENLATREVLAFNLALPFQITKWWNAFMNASVSHINNQADFGNGAVIDLQAWSYSLFTQQTFTLPYKLTGELGGWYSGPGIWGGVFRYEPSWSMNIGIQRKFLNDKINVKLSAEDLFFTSGWKGYSEFNGLNGYGQGSWDSRRVSLSASWNFGNNKVKSRARKAGMESESKRVSFED
jgi:hypothetical protein